MPEDSQISQGMLSSQKISEGWQKDSSFLQSLSLLRLCLSHLKADHAWGHTPYLSFSLLVSLQGLTAT